MPYQPFLIANARTGMQLSMEPWLLPWDAYPVLSNFYLYQGKILKRRGITSFGDLGFDLPVMGLWNYRNNTGGETLLAFDTKRAYYYGSGAFNDLFGADTFTGEDYEYFWMTNWLNNAFIVNGKDQVYIYDGVDMLPLDIVPGGGAGNDITRAVWIGPYKDRLVMLRPAENGILYPQRARWSDPGSYTSWSTESYIDCPTSDWIVGAAFLRNDLYVFFERSIWCLKYSGDSRLPFRWVQICPDSGSLSGLAISVMENEIIFAGPTRIQMTNGNDTLNIDDRIPNFLMSTNQSRASYIYAIVNEMDEQLWFSCADMMSERNDKVLLFNFQDNSYAVLNLAATCFGYYDKEEGLRWGDPELDIPWEDLGWRWGDRDMQGGYPILLGGADDGTVFVINDGNDDLGADISAEMKTARLNPFVKEGRRATLGFVEFLADTQPGVVLTVDFYADHGSLPYQSLGMTLDDGRGEEKSWLRLYSDVDAAFHQLRLRHTGKGNIVIHAVIPWFKPGGRIYDRYV